MARARPTRLRMPPLRSEGFIFSMPASPRRSSFSATTFRISLRVLRVCSTRGKAMFSSTLMESKRAECWNSIPKWCRIRSRARFDIAVTSFPWNRIRPEVGSSRPMICFTSTDFPDPEAPMIAVTRPSRIGRSTPLRTSVSPNCLRKSSTTMIGSTPVLKTHLRRTDCSIRRRAHQISLHMDGALQESHRGLHDALGERGVGVDGVGEILDGGLEGHGQLIRAAEGR